MGSRKCTWQHWLLRQMGRICEITGYPTGCVEHWSPWPENIGFLTQLWAVRDLKSAFYFRSFPVLPPVFMHSSGLIPSRHLARRLWTPVGTSPRLSWWHCLCASWRISVSRPYWHWWCPITCWRILPDCQRWAWDTEAEREWLPFRKRHFHMLNGIVLN